MDRVRGENFDLKLEKSRPNPKIIHEKLSFTQPELNRLDHVPGRAGAKKFDLIISFALTQTRRMTMSSIKLRFHRYQSIFGQKKYFEPGRGPQKEITLYYTVI